MPLATQEIYLARLPARQAELQLLLIPIFSLPYMEKRTAQQVVEAIQRVAKGGHLAEVPLVPRGVLALRGIRVEVVELKPKKEGETTSASPSP